ncbi:LytR/AlgR family response regulator transcription factor [Spirosoma gilvum]
MIRCLAIDDEYLALEVIENHVKRISFLHMVATFTSPLEALPELGTEAIDLLFLDIAMPTINGLDFLQTIKHPPLVILTTAFTQFALDGFNADVVDYLLKPISFERFLKAVQKVQLRLQKPATEDNAEHIFIKSDYRMIRVDFEDILFIEGKKEYVALQTKHQIIDTLLTLTALLEKLPASKFVRVHRSFIVAVNKITSIERNLIFIGEVKIPIGDLFRDELCKRIS